MNYKSNLPRVVSPDELVDEMEVLLQLLEILQLVIVDRGVTEDADTRSQFFHNVAYRFVLAPRRRTRNPKTPQGRGVDPVAVAPDDIHTQHITCVYNIAPLIHGERKEDVSRLHKLPLDVRKVVSRELRIEKYETNG